MSLALVSVASAKVALNNFRRQNLPVDPDNLDHQQAYMTLRDTHGRVNARMMMSYLKTKQEVVTSGYRTTCKRRGARGAGDEREVGDAAQFGGERGSLPDRRRA